MGVAGPGGKKRSYDAARKPGDTFWKEHKKKTKWITEECGNPTRQKNHSRTELTKRRKRKKPCDDVVPEEGQKGNETS